MPSTTLILPPSGPIASLSPGDRALLSSAGTFESIKSGETIIHQGKPHSRLFFLLSGSVQAKHENNGRTEILGTIKAGEWLGEINIFDPSTAVCSVVAVEPTEYWFITRDAFEQFINKNHTAGSILLIGLAMTLSQRIRLLTEKHTESLKSGSKRPLWAALVLMTFVAVAAMVFGIGVFERLKKMEKLDQLRVSELESQLESARVNAKNLETNIARMNEDSEWDKSEAIKKSEASQPTATPQPSIASNVENHVQTSVNAGKESQQPVKSSVPVDRKEVVSAVENEDELVPYPPEIVLTKETLVPLVVGSRVSGNAKIASGRSFKVIGVEESNVLVAMAGATVRIPKENTNFNQARVEATKRASEKKKAEASPTPSPTITPAPKASPTPSPGISRDAKPSPTAEEQPMVQIEKMLKSLEPRKVVDALQDFHKPSKENGKVAFMRVEARKWASAAEMAKNILRNQKPDESCKSLLKNIVLVNEMFESERFEMIEGKLRQIDEEWVELKTDLEIFGAKGEPSGNPE